MSEKSTEAVIVTEPFKTYVLDFDKIQTVEDLKNVLRLMELTITREADWVPPYFMKKVEGRG